MWRKEPRSEQNFSIQNLKGSVNESIQKDYDVNKKRKLRRMPDEARELSLINWQRRQKRLPTNVI